MDKPKDLSSAELEVMKVLWKKGAATVKEVQAALSRKKAWQYTTVLTFIVRLHVKGHLKREKKSSAYVYTPISPEKKTMGRIVQDFLNRAFDGEIAPLMNCLSESKKLKPGEMAALKKLVADLDKKGAGHADDN